MDAGTLIEACGDQSTEAGITIFSVLPAAERAKWPVKPASYEGGRYQHARTWWGTGADRRQVDVLVIDTEPSQANRLEAALEQHRIELGPPEMLLDFAPVGVLTPHLPTRISSFPFPHRNTDAYLLDAMLDSINFLNTQAGAAVFTHVPFYTGFRTLPARPLHGTCAPVLLKELFPRAGCTRLSPDRQAGGHEK